MLCLIPATEIGSHFISSAKALKFFIVASAQVKEPKQPNTLFLIPLVLIFANNELISGYNSLQYVGEPQINPLYLKISAKIYEALVRDTS